VTRHADTTCCALVRSPIVRAVERCAGGLADVDPLRVATKTISGL
jgi:hypothetical protein